MHEWQAMKRIIAIRRRKEL